MAGGRPVLVTGARGYLGGRICRAIAARADLELIGASRQAQPPLGWSAGRFLCLAPTADMTAFLEDLKGVDTIVHLAGSDQAGARSDPAGTLAGTVGNLVRLLKAAIALGIRRFVYVSTAHVYGTPPIGTIDEHSLPRPQNPYAIIHRTAEDFILAARDAGQIEGVVLRLSNGIGAPAWRDNAQCSTLGNDLCCQAATGDVLKLSSSGEQWRDFITLGDIAAAMLHILDLPADRLGDGLFNLGGEMPLRVIDVAELVAQRAAFLFGRNLVINRPQGPAAERLDYRIDKIRATGFQLRGDLTGEIDATLRLCVESFLQSTAPNQG